MKTVYLLPCSCGKKVPVDAAQAGTQVTCACGSQLPVPTIRGLRQLEIQAVEDDASAAPPAWDQTKGMLFSAGMLIATLSAVLAAFNFYHYWGTRDGGEQFKKSHIEQMRHQVEHMVPDDVISEFQRHAKEGLGEKGEPPWMFVRKYMESSFRWLVGALVGMAIGLAIVVVSFLIRPARDLGKRGLEGI